MKAQIVILAGGLGIRLSSVTKDEIPKSMVEVRDKPFIQYQLELLKINKVDNIIIMVGHLWQHLTDFVDRIKDKLELNVKCVYNQHNDPLINLYEMKHLLADHFMVMYGDSFLEFDYNGLYNYHLKRQSMSDSITYVTMAIYRNTLIQYTNNVVIYKTSSSKIYYSKIGFNEAEYIDYGISVVSRDAMEGFKAPILSKQLILEEFYRIISSGYTVDGVVIPTRFYEIGTPESLAEFKRFIDDRYKNSI